MPGAGSSEKSLELIAPGWGKVPIVCQNVKRQEF